MRIIVCGDRNWTDRAAIYEKMATVRRRVVGPITVIEGGAPGADTLAASCARQLGMEVIEVPANWAKHGKAAGPIRNKLMLSLEPDLVLAFHPDLTQSKGTKNMCEQAAQAGVKVHIFNE